eukprot:TRINITY_DN7481_c0_g2_i1.p1 TRINITY_DN7481_c0_g2~~TRINITY_DN7481_c0_g2_i1.p1  ORF type:complete len:148 (-),score=25.52 TRINITY_DN7481_c0_g2_i1:421-864(-)
MQRLSLSRILTQIVCFVPTAMQLLLMGDDAVLAALRPRLSALLGDTAELVTALNGMLEVLPAGASKAKGVAWVLDYLGGLPATELMAIGDGENDIEMLQMARVGVAMGNAGPVVKRAANQFTDSNDDEGFAKAVETFVMEPECWCWD